MPPRSALWSSLQEVRVSGKNIPVIMVRRRVGGGGHRGEIARTKKKKKIVLLSTTRKLGRFFASKCPTPAKSMPVTVSCNRLLVIFSNTTKQKRTESNRSMYWKRWCAEMDSVIRDCFHHNLNRMLYYQFLFINLVPHLQ